MRPLFISIAILFIFAFNGVAQCEKLDILFRDDIVLLSESIEDEIFFTRVDQNKLEILFDQQFDSDTVSLHIKNDSISKIFSTDLALGSAGSIIINRPSIGDIVTLTINRAAVIFPYNSKFNVLHIFYEGCIVYLTYTNRMTIYE